MDDFAGRRAYFEAYLTRRAPDAGQRFTCPCCAYPTLPDRGHYEICSLCGWEDDNQDDPDADQVWGGPNSDYSLSEARHNFAEYLIMYRLSESRIFPQNPRLLTMKRSLIEVYQRLTMASVPLEHSSMAEEEKALVHAMVIVPQRVVPLPGR
jgi:hypothetical protein